MQTHRDIVMREGLRAARRWARWRWLRVLLRPWCWLRRRHAFNLESVTNQGLARLDVAAGYATLLVEERCARCRKARYSYALDPGAPTSASSRTNP